MAGIYRKRTTKHPHKSTHRKTKTGGWVWLSLGLSCGLLGASILFFILSNPLYLQKARTLISQASSAMEYTALTPTAKTHAKKPTQNFEFYNLLPGMEVDLPESSSTPPPITPSKTAPPPPLPSPQKNFVYYIQVGSFRNLTEADQLKARLILQGFQPTIQRIPIKINLTVFRVVLGPFNKELRAQQQKKQLEKHKIFGKITLKNEGV